MNRMLVLLLLAMVPSLAAQGRRAGPPPRDSSRAAQLRGEIERRFAERVRGELGLTDDQAAKLRATHQRFAARRRPLLERQRDLRRALQEQMRPGVAADQDSVRQLMDGLRAGRAQMVKIEEDEQRELAGYLTPVQQAQLQIMRERLLRRVRDARRGRAGGPGGGAFDGRGPRRGGDGEGGGGAGAPGQVGEEGEEGEGPM